MSPTQWIRERTIRPDWAKEKQGIHLGMNAEELGELIDEMSLDELSIACHEEGVELLRSPTKAALQCALRVHFGL